MITVTRKRKFSARRFQDFFHRFIQRYSAVHSSSSWRRSPPDTASSPTSKGRRENCAGCGSPRFSRESLFSPCAGMNSHRYSQHNEAWNKDGNARFSAEGQHRCADNYRSLLPVVRIANVFGLLPLSVVDGQFRFTCPSFLMLYALLVSGSLLGFLITRLLALFLNSRPVEDWVPVLTATVFYILGASGSLLHWRLAWKLPGVLKSWTEWEWRVGVRRTSRCLVIMVLLFVMVSATVETISSMFYNVNKNCTTDFWQFLECYITTGHAYEIKLVGYSDFIGIVVLLINKYATFIWNFNDVLVACIAIVLWRHIKDFNSHIEDGALCWRGKQWLRTREDHIDLLKLMGLMNDALGPIVLQSYVTNLFFTLVQLYLGIRPRKEEDVISKFYLTWSFLHLLGRLLLVSFSCSAVYDSSKKSLIHLLTVPIERYSVEVWRLQQQLQDQEVGLSGYGFFLVNKSFILATTGALVTYEVILLQLNVGDVTPV